MKEKHIGLFLRKKDSAWLSCQSITKNLLDSYLAAFKNSHIYYLDDNNEYLAGLNLEKIDRLIFIDHIPNPAAILQKISCLNKEIVIHIFGDFMLQLNSWIKLKENNYNIQFIAASKKQAQLVENLMKNSKKLEVIPFPLENDFFITDSCKNIKNNQEYFSFIYAGRLNDQKNLIDLIKGFLIFKKTFKTNARLKIIGFQDHIGIPFLGKKIMPGVLAHSFNLLKNELDNPEDLIFLGPLSRESLRKELLNSDAFVSMSTYNDEDFGMIVSEALACGLPCLLSDWAGYSNFKEYCPDFVELVKISKSNFRPEQNILSKKMYYLEDKFKHKNASIEISQKAFHSLSVNAISERLKLKPFSRNFSGWNDLFIKLKDQFELMPSKPFNDGKGNYSQLYRDTYCSYWNYSE